MQVGFTAFCGVVSIAGHSGLDGSGEWGWCTIGDLCGCDALVGEVAILVFVGGVVAIEGAVGFGGAGAAAELDADTEEGGVLDTGERRARAVAAFFAGLVAACGAIDGEGEAFEAWGTGAYLVDARAHIACLSFSGVGVAAVAIADGCSFAEDAAVEVTEALRGYGDGADMCRAGE